MGDIAAMHRCQRRDSASRSASPIITVPLVRCSTIRAPFGGFKQSGNGREWGDHAFGEFLEVKAMLGWAPKTAA